MELQSLDVDWDQVMPLKKQRKLEKLRMILLQRAVFLVLAGTLFFIGPSASASEDAFMKEQKRLLREFSSGSPYYEMRVSKSGRKYFVLPMGPCSCDGGQPAFVECFSDVEKELVSRQLGRSALEKSECLPNAGCSMGRETIYADCAKPRRKSATKKS